MSIRVHIENQEHVAKAGLSQSQVARIVNSLYDRDPALLGNVGDTTIVNLNSSYNAIVTLGQDIFWVKYIFKKPLNPIEETWEILLRQHIRILNHPFRTPVFSHSGFLYDSYVKNIESHVDSVRGFVASLALEDNTLNEFLSILELEKKAMLEPDHNHQIVLQESLLMSLDNFLRSALPPALQDQRVYDLDLLGTLHQQRNGIRSMNAEMLEMTTKLRDLSSKMDKVLAARGSQPED